MNSEMIEKMKENVPAYLGENRISAVFHQIESFFSENLPEVDNRKLRTFSRGQKNDELPNKMKVSISSYISHEMGDIFNFLLQNTNYAQEGIKEATIPQLAKLYSKKYFYIVQNLAIISDYLPFFKYVLLDIPQKAGLLTKMNIDQALDALRNTYYPAMMTFDLTAEHLIMNHQIPHGFAPSSTAFCANESSVFIGTKTNDIYAFHLPGCGHHFKPYKIHFDDHQKTSGPYSIAISYRNILIFTQTDTIVYNIETKKFEQLSKKFKASHPICSDGAHLYSFDFNLKQVSIMTYSNKTIQVVATKQLNFTGKFTDLEFTVPIACNGTFFSILLPGKINTFMIFSLITGELFKTYSMHDKTDPVIAFTLAPHSGRIVSLTSTEIDVFETPQNVPKYLIGIPPPKYENPKGLIDNIDIALYHGRSMFSGSYQDEAIAIASRFIEAKDYTGIHMSLGILLRQDLANSQLANEFLNKVLLMTNDEQMKKYLFAVFMYWIRNKKDGKKVKLPNVANTLLEEGKMFEQSIIFYDCFDFNSFKLSQQAINNIMGFTVSCISLYPFQCDFIIHSFLIKYTRKHITSKQFIIHIPIIQMLMRCTHMELNKVIKKESKPEDFYRTVYFRTWRRITQIIYSTFSGLTESFSDYAQMFNFLDIKLDDSRNTRPIIDMINDSTFLLLHLVFDSPHKRSNPLFESIEDFFKEYDNPMNGQNAVVDTKLFQILSQAYDMHNKDDFANAFFRLRRYLVYEVPSSQHRLNTRLENRAYSVAAVEQLLLNGNPAGIIPINKGDTLSWFLNLTSGLKTKFNIDHEVIICGFLNQIRERVDDFISADEKMLKSFVSLFKFPFVLPVEIIKISKATVEAKLLLSIPLEHIIGDRKVTDYIPTIDNPEELFSCIDDIVCGSKEVVVYRSSLIYSILVDLFKNRAFETTAEKFVTMVLIGSTRVVATMMRAFKHAVATDKTKMIFENLLDVIVCFTNRQNKFIALKESDEVLQGVFMIVDAFRRLFSKPDSHFREFLESKVEEDPKKYGIAACVILNNSLDFVRINAKASIVMKTGEEIEGIIKKIQDDGSFDVYVGTTNKTKNINPPDCSSIWCTPAKNVDLSKANYDIFVSFFDNYNTQRENAYLDVFVTASFLAFTKESGFVQKISEETKSKFTTTDFSNFAPMNTVFEFMNSLPTNDSKQGDFFFSPVGEVANGYAGQRSGTMATMFISEMFVSTPIYPFLAQKISFVVSGEENYQKPTLTLRIAAYTQTSEARFEMNQVVVSTMDPLEEKDVSIEIRPGESTIIVYVDGIEETRAIFSPASTFFYIIADVGRCAVIKYKYTLLPQESYCSVKPLDIDSDTLETGTSDLNVPTSESRIFNNELRSRLGRILNNSLKQLISASLNVPLSIKNFFDVLVNTNEFPLGEETSIDELQRSTMWLKSAKTFIEYAKKNIPTDTKAILEYARKAFAEAQLVSPTNTSAVFLPFAQPIGLQNCFVISPRSSIPLKCLEVEFKTFQSSSQSIIIPYNDIRGTIIEFPIIAKLLVIILPKENSKDVLELVEALSSKHVFYKAIFSKIIEFIQIIFPVVPKKENEISLFPAGALLFQKSNARQNLELFIKLFIAQSGSRIKFNSQYARLPFSGKYVLAILEDGDQHCKFEIDLTPKVVIQSGTFVVINAVKPTIKALSSMTDLSQFTIVYSEMTNTDVIEKEFGSWNVRNSQQLMQVLKDNFTKNEFGKLPLSNKFSYETAKFAYNVIKNIGETSITSIRAHLAKQLQVTRNATPAESLLLPPLSQENTEEKIQYLKEAHQYLFYIIDPRTEAIDHLPPQNIDSIKTNPDKLFSAPVATREQTSWFKRYLKSLPDFVFLILVEFATGKFGLQHFGNGEKIAVRYVDDDSVIKAHASLMLLTIGKFKDESSFASKFNSVLQEYDDSTAN